MLGCVLFPPIGAGDAWGQRQKQASDPRLRIGVPNAKPRTPGTIRLATYNVENLFDDKDDPALTGRWDDKDMAKPPEQKRAVADAIRRIDADILALQEVESYDALVEFRDEYLKDMGYDHVASLDAGDERGIETSVLSRFPLKDTTIWLHEPLQGEHPETLGTRANEWAGKPLVFHRSPLRVTVEVPAEAAGGGAPYELTLFVLHHKSGSQYGYWREAEARRVIELAAEFEETSPGANIAILGDFNAEFQDDSVWMYIQAGYQDLFRDRNVADPRTHTHASNRAIDLILFNRNLAPEIVKESRFILATPQFLEDEDWRTLPKPPGYASDHCPVAVDIRTRDD